MTTALSGPAQALGQRMRIGVESYFNQVNKAGGVNGNTLKLVALDDSYEPDKAAPNMRSLIEKDKVLAVIGNVGTLTAIVTVPIANELKTFEEFSIVSEEISTNISTIQEVTDRTSGGTRQIASNSKQLSKLAEELQSNVAKFVV